MANILTNLNFNDGIQKEEERVNAKGMELVLGKGLMQPFANTISGSRKILFTTQLEHSLPLLKSESPIVQTGYENRFGDYSSSITKAKSDFIVEAKIFKFSKNPNHHYYLITRDINTNELDFVERISYRHLTESYGYLYNNNILDSLDCGYQVPYGEILSKSLAFDEYDNRCDGVNLVTGYIAREKTMEDGIQISKSGRVKLGSPLLRCPQFILNNNDIPLNLYGDDDNYKSFPDIGETVKGGILIGVRREKIEDSLFTQSRERLKETLMSDDKYTVEGKVIDINIYCNTPEELKSKYANTQVAYYYHEKQRMISEIVTTIDSLINKGYTQLSSDLQKLYEKCKMELSGVQYIDNNKTYSGTCIQFVVLENNYPSVGDKLSNRYGGKGVISEIVEDEMMPCLDNGEHIEVLFNSSTCVNRLNPGQLMEVSLTSIGARIVEFIRLNAIDTDDSINLIIKFISLCSPHQAYELKRMLDSHEQEEREFFIDSILDDGNLVLSIKPISESMSLDKLNRIYQEFPWVRPYIVTSPIKDSNGNYRMVEGRRPLVCGKMYMYRLKQYAEEKFSVTSLSSTNIRNENSRSKANKNYRALYQNTPIKFGDMESGDMSHLGMEEVIKVLMIHSVSPQARRLVEKLYTDDPYNVDIKLDGNSTNRNAEILNVYLKTIGLRLRFTKKYKLVSSPVLTKAVYYNYENDYVKPVGYISDDNISFDPVKHIEHLAECEKEAKKRPVMYKPLGYYE